MRIPLYDKKVTAPQKEAGNPPIMDSVLIIVSVVIIVGGLFVLLWRHP